MKNENFKGLVAGLEDAIAYTKGERTRGRVVAGPDVKAIREKSNKSQAQFAKAYHLPVGTLRDWEQGRRQPDAPARALLTLIGRDPETVERILA
jgi:putative transcriptional regulator